MAHLETAPRARGALEGAPTTARREGLLEIGVGAAVPVVAGVLVAWWTPRGPVSGIEVILTVLLAFAVGRLTGRLMRSRWSALLAPLLFAASFEVARLPVSGPTVDGIALDSTYGVIAFVVGRGLNGLLVLVPMIAGAFTGADLAARAGVGGTRLGRLGWAVTGATLLAVGGLAVVLAWPGSTPAILGADGASPPNSIAELRTVSLGGHDQALMIRGRSRDNPVLLYLAGGPGGTDLGAMRGDVGLESHFVVVTWDQRGTGKSYGSLDPLDTINVHGMLADTIQLVNLLRAEFDEERIYLVGNSWGATLGTLVVQQEPELFHAYVGTGQMVSQRATDAMFYEDTLAWAKASGDAALVSSLETLGPPPYADIRGYEYALGHEHDWNAYPELDVDKEMPGNLFVPENSWLDRVNAFRGFLDTFAALYPQLQEIDFRRDVPGLDVPVYMVIGAHEARGRAVLAEEWFAALAAPAKTRFVFAHSGHRPQFEEPAEFVAVMQQVVADTYPGR
jgi:pimeloyl-ACP methyl ester carboxylesterase